MKQQFYIEVSINESVDGPLRETISVDGRSIMVKGSWENKDRMWFDTRQQAESFLSEQPNGVLDRIIMPENITPDTDCVFHDGHNRTVKQCTCSIHDEWE